LPIFGNNRVILIDVIINTKEVNMNTLLEMLIGSLDKILVLIKNVVATGAEADKHVKSLAWLIIRYEPELRAKAMETTNTLDDKIISELVEASEQIWGNIELE